MTEPVSTHPTTQELESYQQRTLAPAALLTVDRHLGTCAPCRRTLLAGNPVVLPEEISSMHGPLHLGYEQLTAYVDNTLTAPQREQVEAHTFFCNSCQTELADLITLESQLAHAPAAVKTPAIPFTRRLASFFTAPGRIREFGLAFAAILVGIFITVHAGRTSANSGPIDGQGAHLMQLGTTAHPGFSLGGLLLITAGLAYLLHSSLKKK